LFCIGPVGLNWDFYPSCTTSSCALIRSSLRICDISAQSSLRCCRSKFLIGLSAKSSLFSMSLFCAIRLNPTVMDSFNPNCPHCVEEHTHKTLNADAPPAPCHHHSMSDPNETLHQCQYCFKLKGAGVTLQRCGACKIDIYCV
jgi:hypothetical protein